MAYRGVRSRSIFQGEPRALCKCAIRRSSRLDGRELMSIVNEILIQHVSRGVAHLALESRQAAMSIEMYRRNPISSNQSYISF